MNLDSALPAFEVLTLAIKSEIEAADFYLKTKLRVKNENLLKKLEFLVYEEKNHRKILERLFSQKFSGKELKIPEESLFPPLQISIKKEFSILDLFRVVLQAEQESEKFYKKSRNEVKDEESKKILEYLSRVERSHYFMIKSEIDLLSRFPEYYDVEDFHFGHDMAHVGP